MAEIDQELKVILREAKRTKLSKEILDKVTNNLTNTRGLIVIEILKDGDSVIHLSVSPAHAIYHFERCKTQLVADSLGITADDGEVE